MILNNKYYLYDEVAAPSGFGDDLTGSFGGTVRTDDNDSMADALLFHTQAWWWENRNPKNEQWKTWCKEVHAVNLLDGLHHDAPPGPTFRQSTAPDTIEVGNQVDNEYGTDQPFPYTVLEVNKEAVIIRCAAERISNWDEKNQIAIPFKSLDDYGRSIEERNAALAERLPLFQSNHPQRYEQLLSSDAPDAKYALEFAVLEEYVDETETDYDPDAEQDLLDYDVQSLFSGILIFADPNEAGENNTKVSANLKGQIDELNNLYDRIGFPEKIEVISH